MEPAADDRHGSGLRAIGSWFTAVKGMSPGLMVTIFATFFLYLAVLIVVWRYIHGAGTFAETLYAMGRDRSQGWIEIELLADAPFSLGLFWFTFLSKSKLVTEDDRKCVVIMFVGAAIAFANFAFDHFRLP